MLKFLYRILYGSWGRTSKAAALRLANIRKLDAAKPEAVSKPSETPTAAHGPKPSEDPIAAPILKPAEQEQLKAAEAPTTNNSSDADAKKDLHKKLEPGEEGELREKEYMKEQGEPSEGDLLYQLGPRATLDLIEKVGSSAKLGPIEKIKLRERLERLQKMERDRKLEVLEKQKTRRRGISERIHEIESLLPYNPRSGRDQKSILSHAIVYVKSLQQDYMATAQDLSAALTEIARLETTTETDDNQKKESDAALRALLSRLEELKREVEDLRKQKKSREAESPPKKKK